MAWETGVNGVNGELVQVRGMGVGEEHLRIVSLGERDWLRLGHSACM